MEHTKGEWKLKNHQQYSNCKEIVVDGKVILTINSQIANDSESEANAAICESAPTMYEALLHCKEVLNLAINSIPTGELRNKLCDANIEVCSAII